MLLPIMACSAGLVITDSHSTVGRVLHSSKLQEIMEHEIQVQQCTLCVCVGGGQMRTLWLLAYWVDCY